MEKYLWAIIGLITLGFFARTAWEACAGYVAYRRRFTARETAHPDAPAGA